jgi:hypothetical protein
MLPWSITEEGVLWKEAGQVEVVVRTKNPHGSSLLSLRLNVDQP